MKRRIAAWIAVAGLAGATNTFTQEFWAGGTFFTEGMYTKEPSFGNRSKDDAPSVFGQETRYGHRAYGGVLTNVGR